MERNGGTFMFVYTTRRNDTLYSIGTKYRVSVDEIRAVNGLVDTRIVPGQSLYINQPMYIVQPGDTFYSVSRMAFVPSSVLKSFNPRVDVNNLRPGMVLHIPSYPNYSVTNLGYAVLQTPEMDVSLISNFAPYLTYTSLFEYHIFADGTLSQLRDQSAIQAALGHHVGPLATVTNLTANGFDTALLTTVLHSPEARQNLVDQIFGLLTTKGYVGVNIDFESVAAEDRDYYSDFLRRLSERLKSGGYLLTVAVPPKVSEDVPWLLGYDYGAIGSVVDFVFIMAYDFHEAQSAPGPVAPIRSVRQTIEFALLNIDRNKILLGVPLYGYDWPLAASPQTVGTAISVSNAVELAMRYQVPIRYSQEAESPYFRYVDESGQNHIVWFEDPRSMSVKLLLVHEYRLKGLGAWQLNLNLPQGPWLLRKFFRIQKVV